MKVLIATGLYPPEIGGPATYTALLERELPARGCTVSVLPFSRSRSLPKGIRHIHYLFLLLKEARQADVMLAQDTVSVGLPALLVAKLLRLRYIVRVPGDYAWEQSVQRYGVTETIDEFQKKSYTGKIRLLQNIQRFVVRSANQVITPSNYFKELVEGWGVPADNVFTIYNGVNLDITPAQVEKPAPLLMVTSGRLVSWKGMKTLILLLNQLPGWHLLILGDGPERSELESLAKEQGLTNRVTLKGSVSREEVFGWCKVADAFVLNTSFESFSFQIVEAMYAGVPVVTTTVGSLPELITSGEEGILVKPDDKEALVAAIKTVVHDKLGWQKMTSAARTKAEQFSIKRTTDSLMKLLIEYDT